MVWHVAVVAAVVLGVNVLPAFGPPTWSLLVFFRLHWHVDPVVLVAVGALSAACGRLLLAHGTRLLRERLPPRRVESLTVVAERLTQHRGRAVLGLALFAVSPIPSAQLFEAAGLLGVALLPLTAAFFVGRVVSYSLYVGAATLAEDNVGDILRSAVTSPWGVAVQVAFIAGLVVLARVDWAARFGKRSQPARPEGPPTAAPRA